MRQKAFLALALRSMKSMAPSAISMSISGRVVRS